MNATIPQLYEVLGIISGRLAKEGSLWLQLDKERLQERVIKDPDRLAKAFVEFMAHDARLIVGELKTFPINRSSPFDPAKFIGAGWSIWKGPKDGDGLSGEEQQDARSLQITELDLSRIRFEHCLEGSEKRITGETKLARQKRDERKFIRVDAQIAQALFQEPGHRTLEWIRNELKRTWFDIPGTELRSPNGSRCILSLYWGGDRWCWFYHYLGNAWDAENPSLLLANSALDT